MRKFLLLSALVAMLPSMLSATVKHPVPEPTAAPVVGDTFYLYNVKHNAFLNRGETWQTRVGTSSMGMAFTWIASPDEGYYNLQSIKNRNPVYLYCGSQWETWYDSADNVDAARFSLEPIEGTNAYYFHCKVAPTQYAFNRSSGWNDRAIQSWIDKGSEDCQWQFISEVDYQEYLKAMDAYASAYGKNLDACLTHYGNMWTLGGVSHTESWNVGYRTNGNTSVPTGEKFLRLNAEWSDVYLYDELFNIAEGDYEFYIDRAGWVQSGGWYDTFATTNPANNWKSYSGGAGYLGNAGTSSGYVTKFYYDPEEGSLGVGVRCTGGITGDIKANWQLDIQKFHLTWKGTGKHTVTVGESCYATLFLPYAVTIPDGITAYTGVVNGEYLTLTALEGGVIPAETAVVLKATAAGDYTFTKTTADAFSGSNDLLGDISKTQQDGTDTYYALANANGIGFYKVAGESSIPGFKAYLKQAPAAGIKAFLFTEDNATSISSLTQPLTTGEQIYNLAGQRLQKMQKGINIVGGKKVLK